jgi:polyisoprenoid-binding protein YceI
MNLRHGVALTILGGAILGGAILAGAAAQAAPTTWKIDPNHSRVTFSIRHIFSKVPGTFDSFSGTIQYDADNPSAASTRVEIDPKSVNTNVQRRDNDLRGPDFFDAEKYPTITFVSTGVKDLGNGSLEVAGNLSLHGVTKPVTLKTTLLGSGPAMNGQVRAGFEATTTIDRKDFGIVWNRQLDQGGMLLGDDVAIQLDIEAVAEPAESGQAK